MQEPHRYTFTEFIAEELAQSDDFARVWHEKALIRAVRHAIIDARANAGLTQAQLAEKLGVKQSVVARYEKGN